MKLLKLYLRDVCWLVVVLAMACAWWRQASLPANVNFGERVSIVRFDPGFGPTVVRGLVSSVSDETLRIDASTSSPCLHGVVYNASGDYLGVITGDDRGDIDAVRAESIRALLETRPF